MLEKKLLTAACALGILLWGACFLPPVHQTPPPPPPPMRARAIHSICVTVEDLSTTRNIDPDLVLSWIIEYLNSYEAAGGPRAGRCEGAGAADAVLQIALSNESAAFEETDSASPQPGYRYSVQVDAVLTARDGTLLWREASPTHRSRRFPGPRSPNPWKSIAVKNWLRYDVCHSLVPPVLNEQP